MLVRTSKTWYGLFIGKELWSIHETKNEAEDRRDVIIATEPIRIAMVKVTYHREHGSAVDFPVEVRSKDMLSRAAGMPQNAL